MFQFSLSFSNAHRCPSADIAVNFTDGMFKGIYHGKQYHVPDIQTVLSRAWRAGVDRIIVTGGSLEGSKEALAIAETDGRLFCTVGVHPTRCKIPCRSYPFIHRKCRGS
uniref:Uncharacterized protein n=1 Tax=Opuntia streptacantha TaxID=393608 RepID=A0A7C9DRT8_OPUST